MELNRLYDIADKEKIGIINYKMLNKAIICEANEKYYIGINYSKIDTYTEEKEILAEELGHYYCGATYCSYDNKTFISKQEYRARKWSYNVLIPYEDLKLAVKNRL